MSINNNTGSVSKAYQINSTAETTLRSLPMTKSTISRIEISDKVKLSERAQLIKDVRELVDQSPDIRTQKVVDLKKQIDNGRYTPNIDTVVEKLLNSDLSVKI